LEGCLKEAGRRLNLTFVINSALNAMHLTNKGGASDTVPG
jgi:hypothetical protein